MIAHEPGIWFKSTRFSVEPGEDLETNPRIYGRQPALWLRSQLLARGYAVEDVFGDDWGWCVMCQREPFRMWVGCANLSDGNRGVSALPPPERDKLLWHVVPMAQVPFLRYLFRSKPDTRPALERLTTELQSILENESSVDIVDESVTDTWYET